jgi:hypothetical protein
VDSHHQTKKSQVYKIAIKINLSVGLTRFFNQLRYKNPTSWDKKRIFKKKSTYQRFKEVYDKH